MVIFNNQRSISEKRRCLRIKIHHLNQPLINYEYTMTFSIKKIYSVKDSDPAEWDALGKGQPFSSYSWYQFGEKVLTNDRPVYFIASQDSKPIARATFWLKREDSLPVPSPIANKTINTIFRRWPLMICQSPLSSAGGLILPDSDEKTMIFELILEEAIQYLHEKQASFLVLDYLTQHEAQKNTYGDRLFQVPLPEQGTSLKIEWDNFPDYLKQLSKNERKSHKRNTKRANELGVEIKPLDRGNSVDEAMKLIAEHDRRYNAPALPWTRKMIELSDSVNSVWLGAYIKNKLVGCELLLEDNGSWVATALGRDYSYPYVYFVMGYASIKAVIDHRGKYLRWGTGTYEYKKRMGFQLEDNHYVSFLARNKLVNSLFRKIAPKLI